MRSWPDAFDAFVTAVFMALVFGLPLLGYIFMVFDFRAYLRAMRRALIVVGGYVTDLPDWLREHTPRPVAALGLTMPCTEADVLAAYRRQVKRLHPDRGGDREKFLRLQRHFEQALALVRNAP